MATVYISPSTKKTQPHGTGMNILKAAVNGPLSLAGLRLSKIQPPPAPAPPSPIIHHGIELVLDVGASDGKLFATETRQLGYGGRMVSFEPLPDAHAKLTVNAANDPNWIIHERVALGAAPGEVDINIAGNSWSSSILPMLDAHLFAAPQSAYVGKTKTPVITLDSVFDRYRTGGERTYLKIDTQGFEAEVLKGLPQHLKDVFAVQLELSLVPLYEGQELYRYFLDFFEARGFCLWSILPEFTDKRTGQMLQFDGVFVRRD